MPRRFSLLVISYFVLSVLLASNPASGLEFDSGPSSEAKESDWNPRTPLDYNVSFHAKILNGVTDGVAATVGENCSRAIRNFLNSGNNFYSEIMDKEHTIFVKNSERPETSDNEFFHYSRAEEMHSIALTKNFDSFFSFLRNRSYPSNWYLYIAEDPVSSQRFGHIKAVFTLRSGAKIYFPGVRVQDKGDGNINSHFGDFAIEQEQMKKDERLQVCSKIGMSGDTGHTHPILTLLAAEANHMDLIAYFGRGTGWYQVLGPWAFATMQVY